VEGNQEKLGQASYIKKFKGHCIFKCLFSLTNAIVILQIILDAKSYLVEAHYYMKLHDGNEVRPVALVSFYGPPHEALYQASSKCYWTVQHLGDVSMKIIDIHCIQSVVCLVPDTQYSKYFQDGSENNRWYLMEKPGLKLSLAVGREEILTNE